MPVAHSPGLARDWLGNGLAAPMAVTGLRTVPSVVVALHGSLLIRVDPLIASAVRDTRHTCTSTSVRPAAGVDPRTVTVKCSKAALPFRATAAPLEVSEDVGWGVGGSGVGLAEGAGSVGVADGSIVSLGSGLGVTAPFEPAGFLDTAVPLREEARSPYPNRLWVAAIAPANCCSTRTSSPSCPTLSSSKDSRGPRSAVVHIGDRTRDEAVAGHQNQPKGSKPTTTSPTFHKRIACDVAGSPADGARRPQYLQLRVT